MKKSSSNRRFWLALPLLTAAAAMLFPAAALAASPATAAIPIETQVTGSGAPTGTPFQFLMTAENGAPLPENMPLTVFDTGKGTFDEISYTMPGDYHYTVTQIPGGAEHFTYDGSVYHLTVRVTNDGKGGLRSEFWATRNDETEKTACLLFTNAYRAPVGPTPTPAEPPAPTAAPAAAPRHRGAVPQTGDPVSLALWGLLSLGSLGGCAAACGLKRRKR